MCLELKVDLVVSAKIVAKNRPGVGVMQVIGFVNRVMDVEADVDLDRFTMAEVESNAVRCPDSEAAERMYSGAPCPSSHDFGL